MGRKVKATLYINTRMGHECVPTEHESIAEATRNGYEGPGFYFRVIANGKVRKRGYCRSDW